MKRVKANVRKNSVEKLYQKLNIIKYGAMALSLFLILGSVVLLEYSQVPLGVAVACFIIGMIGSPFAILMPQVFWRCPLCKERLQTRRRGILVKPGKACPHCGVDYHESDLAL